MSENSPKVRRQVADELGLYVYMLVDPRTGVPFYVGKGRGERFASHGYEAMFTSDPSDGDVSESEGNKKVEQIREIRRAGVEPQIWILRHGMRSNAEYTAVEAATIDLLRSFPVRPKTSTELRLPDGFDRQLTNRRREQKYRGGIMLLEDLVAETGADELTYEGPLLTIDLGQWTETPWGEPMPGGWKREGHGYKAEWLTRSEREKNYEEICKSACGWWILSKHRLESSGIDHIVAVHRKVTRALLRIKPGSWEVQTYAPKEGAKKVDRRVACEFEAVKSGELFDQLVGPYGRRLPDKKKGARNQFYWPRGQ
ncbi:GIY-YIG nuclease family protein [Bowdeniella massiliensis]|uniref:GIY-YIG nuclease family protein n=1 Tax=Bowdeniella massiliensis TaxID=2932264 RepID=UPI002027973D|nr:GIY-YIG nuclease family protein [Bowdeniella massiliensis]